MAEFYQTTDELARETGAAQRRSWLVVAATMAVMYLLLFGLVRRGSQTIDAQRRELGERVAELSRLLERNAQLDARVRGAAARATAVNERFLRRISADLHDGPGQDLGFALMRLEAMVDRLRAHRAGFRRAGRPAGGLPGGPREPGIGARRPALDLGGTAAAGDRRPLDRRDRRPRGPRLRAQDRREARARDLRGAGERFPCR